MQKINIYCIFNGSIICIKYCKYAENPNIQAFAQKLQASEKRREKEAFRQAAKGFYISYLLLQLVQVCFKGVEEVVHEIFKLGQRVTA